MLTGSTFGWFSTIGWITSAIVNPTAHPAPPAGAAGHDRREKRGSVGAPEFDRRRACRFSARPSLMAAGSTTSRTRMSFFITSAGSGNGANLGGLAGADKICFVISPGKSDILEYYGGGYGDSQQLRGRVSWVDERSQVIRLDAGSYGGQMLEVRYDSRTYVEWRGQRYPARDLDAGDVVRIDARRSGNAWFAERIVMESNAGR